jgi:putative transposase
MFWRVSNTCSTLNLKKNHERLCFVLDAAGHNSRHKEYQFRRQDNRPMELFSDKFIVQKLNYIHNNPVEAGIVDIADHYLYSGARSYSKGKKYGLIDVDLL